MEYLIIALKSYGYFLLSVSVIHLVILLYFCLRTSLKLIPAFLKYTAMLPLHWIMIHVTYILSPLLPVFAIGREKLPSWLSWFQTPRDPLSGSDGFQEDNKNLPEYLVRTKWLIRNPAYGFAHDVIGTRSKDGVKTNYSGNIKTHDGWAGVLFIWTEDYRYFCLKIYQPSFPGMTYKFRIGWKIHAWAKNGCSFGHRRKFLFTVNPVKEREFI